MRRGSAVFLMSLAYVAAFTTSARAQSPDDDALQPKIEAQTKVFSHDFRNNEALDKNFRFAPPSAAERFKFEPEGLRITLPADVKKPATVGVVLEEKVRGDFEITIAYEFLQVDKPKNGGGTGFEFYLMTDTSTKEALAFDRRIRTSGQDTYSCGRLTTNNGKRGSLPGTNFKDLPAVGKQGQMRITRVGNIAILSVAEEMSKDFRVLYSVPLGPEDLTLVRFAANPGGSVTTIDLRLLDVQVRSGTKSGVAEAKAVELPLILQHDFRKQTIPAELTKYQIDSGIDLKLEPEGARITIPKSVKHTFGGAGFATPFGLKGDFEVTAAIEILAADEPPPNGYGVGCSLYAQKADGVSAIISRLRKPGNEQIILTVAEQAGSSKTPNTETRLRLRLQRLRNTVYYSWAPGFEGGNFKQIKQMPFDDTDVKHIRLVALNGRTSSIVDVRLIEMTIRGEKEDNPTAAVILRKDPTSGKAKNANNAEAGGSGGVAAALIIGLLVTLFAAVAVWFYVRRRRQGKTSAPAEADQDEEPKPKAAAAPIAFQCSHCDRKLKVKAELAGKRIKCPQCATAVSVPS
jgi:hypothetical protein